MEGLYMLRRPEDVAKLRGISIREVLGVGNGAPAEATNGTDSTEEAPKEVEAPTGEAATEEEEKA
jgi:small subunit ribosomal protein S5